MARARVARKDLVGAGERRGVSGARPPGAGTVAWQKRLGRALFSFGSLRGIDSDPFLDHRVGMSPTVALDFKRTLATAVRRKMAADNLSVAAMARMTKTGRNAVKRLLDERNTAISLKTMAKAASALDLEIKLSVRPLPVAKLDLIAKKIVEAPTAAEAEQWKDRFVEGFYGKPVRRHHA